MAEFLDVEYSTLIYQIYKLSDNAKYTTFTISKKSGGRRIISEPFTSLKIIQQKLNQVLQSVYEPKIPVHSYILSKNIVTNSTLHLNNRYVLNIDLKDFFPSINFGRVRGMFMAKPYLCNAVVSTILAQICCFKNELPQGVPTSPIISNMICAKLDSQLRKLAVNLRCHYTRYADDITFSTSIKNFPEALAYINSIGQVEIGYELKKIVKDNGFEVNPRKIKLQIKNSRQKYRNYCK